jgi:uncharacterized protein with PIN domain
VTGDRRLGRCPDCGHELRPADELISYERSEGSVGVFAECPGCGRVVAPETERQ